MTDQKPTVIRLTQTCDACPSQWEGLLDDGRWLYIRFRWGTLRCSAGSTPEAAIWGDGETFFYDTISDGLDGIISLSEVATHVPQLNWIPVLFPDDQS